MHVCIQQDEFHLVKPNEGPGALYVGNGWNLSGGINGPSLIGYLFIHASLVRDIYSLLWTADQGFSYTLFQAARSGRSGPLFWTLRASSAYAAPISRSRSLVQEWAWDVGGTRLQLFRSDHYPRSVFGDKHHPPKEL